MTSSGRQDGSLRVPREMWVAVVVVVLGGAGSAVGLWVSFSSQLAALTTRVQARESATNEAIEGQRRELDQLRREFATGRQARDREMDHLRGDIAALGKKIDKVLELLARDKN